MKKNWGFDLSFGNFFVQRLSRPTIFPTSSYASIILVAIIGTFFLSCEPSQQIEKLRLTKVGPFSATLEWETQNPGQFVVEYGEGELFDRELVSNDAKTKHKVSLTGLKPSTRYTYRIKPGGTSASFRSAPGTDGAFDMVILDANSPLCKKGWKKTEIYPDIAIVSGDCEGSLANRPESILTLHIPESGTLQMTYGKNLLLIAPTIESAVSYKVREPDSKKRLIYVVSAIRKETTIPDQQVCIGPKGSLYQGKNIYPETDSGAWVEVDAYEIAWVYPKGVKHHREVIVEAPPETRKTCLYCDRLMEAGRYEESIAWYRNFIETNQDRHAIEDAVYSIGRILDEKLFKYPEAIGEYSKFLQSYPASRRKTLIKYRLKYLESHSDNHFIPLLRFEKEKARLVRDHPIQTVENVESIVMEFSESAIVPEALFWMGHLLEREDPDRAQKYYKDLIQKFPKIENAAVASIAIGDILYRNEKYLKAVNAYRYALTISPDTYRISIDDKIRKSKRNIKREIARYISWATILFWIIVTVILRSTPKFKDFWAAVLVTSIYGLIGSTYFALTFEKSRSIVPLVAVITFSAGTLIFWNRAVSRSLRKKWIAIVHMLSLSIALIYLLLFAFHQLYVFGL